MIGWETAILVEGWQSEQYSLYFNANDDNANFDNRTNLDDANDNYAGGLVVLGLCLNNPDNPDVTSGLS